MARKEVGKLNVSIEGDHSKLSKVLKEAERKVKQTGKVIEKESKLDVFNSQMQKALGAFAVMEFGLRGVTAGVNAYADAVEGGATEMQALVKASEAFIKQIPVIGTAYTAASDFSNRILVPIVRAQFGAQYQGLSDKEFAEALSKSDARKRLRRDITSAGAAATGMAFTADPNLTQLQRAEHRRQAQIAAIMRKQEAFKVRAIEEGLDITKMKDVLDTLSRAITTLKDLPLLADPKQQKDLSKMISDPAAAIEQISRGAFSTAIGAFEIAGRPGEDVVQKSQLDELKQINRNTSDLAPTGIAF